MDKAIFLDREGTINKDTMYPHKIEDFILLPGVIEALKNLSKEFIFFIITNQSGIGRGIFEDKDFHIFNNHLISVLRENGIEVKKTYYCPHAPEQDCDCRKPNLRYIKDAEKEFDIDLKNSWVIGDHPHDVEMGIKAGIKSIYLLSGHGQKHFQELEIKNIKPAFIAKGLLEASEFIINDQ